MRQLYPVQEAHAQILMESIHKHGAALDGSATGTGKTLVAASICAEVDNPCLVVSPKALLPMWREELKQRKVKPIGVINYEMLRSKKGSPFGKWTHGHWQWAIPPNTVLIFDEIQKCKSPNSLNGRILLASKPYFVLGLSATAAESAAEMRALGYILGLHKLSNWWPWARERGCFVNHWGHLEFNDDPAILQTLHQEIFPEHGHRLLVSDLKEHFTETQIIMTPLDFGDEVKKLYTEMGKELAKLAEEMTTDSTHPAARALVVTLRARQSVELCKVPLMLEMIEDLLAEHRSIVVFLNFDASIEAVRERLNVPYSIIRGGQTPKFRQEQIDAFQHNQVKVVLCNLQAGGVGVSLHDMHGEHPRTSLISPDWSPHNTIQAMGRIHRADGQTPSQQHVLWASDTIEEHVRDIVIQKCKNISLINDGKGLTANEDFVTV